MIVVFGIGYLSSTIGIIGVGFVIGAYEPCEEKWLNDGLIYKEIGIGNAISDYRGKRVEIYKTISWLPLIEWKIKSKDYYDIITYTNQLSVNYKKAENKIYLSTSGYSQNEQKWITWNDVISLE